MIVRNHCLEHPIETLPQELEGVAGDTLTGLDDALDEAGIVVVLAGHKIFKEAAWDRLKGKRSSTRAGFGASRESPLHRGMVWAERDRPLAVFSGVFLQYLEFTDEWTLKERRQRTLFFLKRLW